MNWCREFRHKSLARWCQEFTLKNNLPSWEIRNWRLGIQWALLYLVINLVLLIRPIIDFLGPTGAILGVSATMIYDSSGGATVRKAADRALGTIFAWIFTVVTLLPLWICGYRSQQEYPWLVWYFYGSAVGCGFYWGYLCHLVGFRDHFGLLVSGTTVSLFTYGMYLDDWMLATHLCCCMNLGGIVIGIVVYSFVFPTSARFQIRQELGKIFRHMSDVAVATMEICGELPAASLMDHNAVVLHNRGIELSPSKLVNVVTPTRQLGWNAKCLIRATLPRRISSIFRSSRSPPKPQNRVPALFGMRTEGNEGHEERFRESFSAVECLLPNQQALLPAAEKEVFYRGPIYFGSDEYKIIIIKCSHLYYQFLSLYQKLGQNLAPEILWDPQSHDWTAYTPTRGDAKALQSAMRYATACAPWVGQVAASIAAVLRSCAEAVEKRILPLDWREAVDALREARDDFFHWRSEQLADFGELFQAPSTTTPTAASWQSRTPEDAFERGSSPYNTLRGSGANDRDSNSSYTLYVSPELGANNSVSRFPLPSSANSNQSSNTPVTCGFIRKGICSRADTVLQKWLGVCSEQYLEFDENTRERMWEFHWRAEDRLSMLAYEIEYLGKNLEDMVEAIEDWI